jgi:predicted nucleotide-binding protein
MPNMTKLLVSREQVNGVLLERIRIGEDLVTKEVVAKKAGGHRDWISLFADWRDHTMAELRAVYDDKVVPIEFEFATESVDTSSSLTDFSNKQESLDSGLKKLRDLIDRLELAVEPRDLQSDVAAAVPGGERVAGPANRNVFLVHGREASGFREAAARFLEKLGLNAVILAEQANEGRTLIEKFEDKALEVGYAVVLLTPEDSAYGLSDQPPTRPNRARQNVILELGYFMARLGRKRVVALLQEGVEVPTDILGIAYIPLDESGAWRTLLARELAAAGFEIDTRKLLG